MIDFLIVRLGSDCDAVSAEVSWLGVSQSGAVIDSGKASLREIGELHASMETKPKTVVLVPACEVLLSAVEVPAGQQRYAKQALPFLVEEKLVDDIEDIHLAMGPVSRGQMVPVAVVRHYVIIQWLDALYCAGLQPNWLVSEALALPWSENTISVYLETDQCLIRDGQWHALGCDTPNAALILETLLQQGAESEHTGVVNLYHGDGESITAAAKNLEQELKLDARLRVLRHCLADSEHEMLGPALISELPRSLNLMQGGYKVENPGISGTLNLRRVGLTLTACVALQLFALLGVGLWLSWQSDKMTSEATALYRSWFPEVRRIINPRRQLESQLANHASAGSEQLLAYLSDLLSVWNIESERLRLRSLDYEGESQRLSLEIEARDEEQLRQLRQGLDSLGIESELRRVAREGGAVAGRLELLGT